MDNKSDNAQYQLINSYQLRLVTHDNDYIRRNVYVCFSKTPTLRPMEETLRSKGKRLIVTIA